MQLEALFKQPQALPAIPKIVHELIDSFNNQDVSIDDIAKKLAADPVLQRHDHTVWRDHLAGFHGRRKAEGYLRAWAKEDFYFRLDEDVAMIRRAGLTVDIFWRRESFAVLVGRRPR